MNITEDAQFRSYLLKQIEEREFSERTGVHCSDLIYCLNKQALRRITGEKPTEQELLLFSIGWSTQAWISGKFIDVPEVEVDRIKVTLDASVCPECGGILE